MQADASACTHVRYPHSLQTSPLLPATHLHACRCCTTLTRAHADRRGWWLYSIDTLLPMLPIYLLSVPPPQPTHTPTHPHNKTRHNKRTYLAGRRAWGRGRRAATGCGQRLCGEYLLTSCCEWWEGKGNGQDKPKTLERQKRIPAGARQHHARATAILCRCKGRKQVKRTSAGGLVAHHPSLPTPGKTSPPIHLNRDSDAKILCAIRTLCSQPHNHILVN